MFSAVGKARAPVRPSSSIRLSVGRVAITPTGTSISRTKTMKCLPVFRLSLLVTFTMALYFRRLTSSFLLRTSRSAQDGTCDRTYALFPPARLRNKQLVVGDRPELRFRTAAGIDHTRFHAQLTGRGETVVLDGIAPLTVKVNVNNKRLLISESWPPLCRHTCTCIRWVLPVPDCHIALSYRHPVSP